MNKSDYHSYCEIKFLLISPFKLRKVADVIRNKHATEALKILKIMPQKGAIYLYKALNSALHNAVNNSGYQVQDMYIKHINIGEGKTLKRFKARARGRGNTILKRSSHIKIGLNSKTGVKNGSES